MLSIENASHVRVLSVGDIEFYGTPIDNEHGLPRRLTSEMNFFFWYFFIVCFSGNL